MKQHKICLSTEVVLTHLVTRVSDINYLFLSLVAISKLLIILYLCEIHTEKISFPMFC